MTKRILTVWNGQQWSKGALDLSCWVAHLSDSELTGIFADMQSGDRGFGDSLFDNPVLTLLQPEVAIDTKMHASAALKHACSQKGVKVRINEVSEFPESTLLQDTLFADIVIADQPWILLDQFKTTPPAFIESLLTGARCPVIIAPKVFKGVDEIIFAYNRSYSSVFAMKQFAYLFPELISKKLTVVEVSDSDLMTDYAQLDGWLRSSFGKVSYELLEGKTADCLFEFILERPKSLLVIGAYGRNAVSKFFKPSAADSVIKDSSVPIFITHH